MDRLIGAALRYGVLTSIAFILAGLALLLARGGAADVLGTNSPLNTSTISPAAVASGLTSLDPLSVILLGLTLLIATPILRVALGIASFARERDWLYVLITSIVFVNLMIAIFVLPSALHL
ncbi:MAG: DUF1634 domain-containing protein [Nitrososphaeria archaeon]